jgi:hypothetical protein
MQKNCPAKSIALMLLIYETIEFVEKDLRPVQRYVQEKLHVEDWRLHFRFNREWWRKRVRMLAPKAKGHASSRLSPMDKLCFPNCLAAERIDKAT